MPRASQSSAPAPLRRSDRKRQAILLAATAVFLQHGFLGTNMDEVAARSGVSKQTVYKHFTSKEALFIAIVGDMTTVTGDNVSDQVVELREGGDLAAYLRDYAVRQLNAVLTPPVLQLRRLVIGEATRFPELGQVLYQRGPMRAISMLADLFARLARRSLLTVRDPLLAASHFNWLVMSSPLNQAMLLGDKAIPKPPELRKHVAEAVRVFLAAYGRD